MKCSCGTSYSDNDEQWKNIDLSPSRTDIDFPLYRVFAATCPDCGTVGIKCYFGDTYRA